MNFLNMLLKGPKRPCKRFFVHGAMPGLNQFIAASNANKHQANRIKQSEQQRIMWEIKAQLKGWKTNKPVFFIFKWVEKDKRRDLDNVAFAKKFLQDAMVEAGVIPGDGWQHVVGFLDLFYIDKNNPGVEVTIWEVENEQ